MFKFYEFGGLLASWDLSVKAVNLLILRNIRLFSYALEES